MCRRLALSPADHILEIGGGWGGLPPRGLNVRLSGHDDDHFGRPTRICRRTGRHRRPGRSGHRARRRLPRPDRHLRQARLDRDDRSGELARPRRLLRPCARLLRPDGLAAIQAIVIANESFERAKHHDDFIRRYISPGGCLPSVTSIAAASSGAGLRMVDLEDIGLHYAETLRRWRLNIRREEAAVATLGLDPDFRRLWDLYLAYCEAAFLERHITDVQVVMAMPEWRDSLTTGAALSRRAPWTACGRRPVGTRHRQVLAVARTKLGIGRSSQGRVGGMKVTIEQQDGHGKVKLAFRGQCGHRTLQPRQRSGRRGPTSGRRRDVAPVVHPRWRRRLKGSAP